MVCELQSTCVTRMYAAVVHFKKKHPELDPWKHTFIYSIERVSQKLQQAEWQQLAASQHPMIDPQPSPILKLTAEKAKKVEKKRRSSLQATCQHPKTQRRRRAEVTVIAQTHKLRHTRYPNSKH